MELLSQFSELNRSQARDVSGKSVEVVGAVFVNDSNELKGCVPHILCLEAKQVMRGLENHFEVCVLRLQVSLDQCLDENAEAEVDDLGILALESFDQLWGDVLFSVKRREKDFLHYVLQVGLVVLDFV